jgi:O-methyltransferase
MDNTLITQDRLDEIIRLAKLTEFGTYPIAEVGVYKGGSLKLLAQSFPDTPVFGFDTFNGLPKQDWDETEYHEPGEFNDTSLESVRQFVNESNASLFKGYFPFTRSCFDNMKFSFVHVDVDYYQATLNCITYFYSRMSDGGVIVIDDYLWPNCPGVAKALKHFEFKRTNTIYQAYIQF